MDKKFFNILVLGLSFMLVFTAFQTCGMIQQTVLDSMGGFGGAGFISLAIIYIVFAAANWIAPLVVSLITAKWSMILGGILYCVFIAVFLHPYIWSLYLGSVLIGFGAAFIWTGQGSFLTLNSDSDTMARNSGIFWAMLQCSLFFGNIFVFFEFNGKTVIDDRTRYTVFTVLLVVAIIGVFVMLILRPAVTNSLDLDDKENAVSDTKRPLQSIVRAFQLLFTKRMGMLTVNNFYTGLELGFFSGVYGTCIGRTNVFGTTAKQLVGINGIFIGVGEVLGGAIFGLLGKKTIVLGRDPIIMLGYVVHMVSFFLVFLNIPADATLHPTNQPAYINSSMYLAIVCSFLMGFGDSCFNTQTYSIIGSLYPDDSAPAFALFKFMQSLAAAIAFFYSSTLELPWQLLILVIFGTIGTWMFCLVEWDVFTEQKKKKAEDVSIEAPFGHTSKYTELNYGSSKQSQLPGYALVAKHRIIPGPQTHQHNH